MSHLADGPAAGWTLWEEHQPVMGTHLELQITAPTEVEARAAGAAAVDEARRLEAMFTVFDPASELCRWRSGALEQPGPELFELLTLAAGWQRRSGGAFNPMAGLLTERWRRAVEEGTPPSSADLHEIAASIAGPRFAVEGASVARLGDCGAVDLNAIAKGHVVDLVARRVLADHDVSRLVINAGGDLVHRGVGGVRVGVEDPHRPYDNVAPMAVIEVAGAAVATSGRARRWFEVGGVRHSRVLDPRTGLAVAHLASATVVAPDAGTADVLATVASVRPPAETLELVHALGADGALVACLLVDEAGAHHASRSWAQLLAS